MQRQHGALPRHVVVANPSKEQARNALPILEKLFLDILRRIAYRAETRMMATVTATRGQQPSPRLRALFQTGVETVLNMRSKMDAIQR